MYTLDIPTILSSAHVLIQYSLNFGVFSLSFIDAISYSFLGAAFIKSAQFGAHI
jgi:hypothetical protein